jgi:hypothetical protein
MSIIGHQQRYYEHLQQDLGERYKTAYASEVLDVHQEANICKVTALDLSLDADWGLYHARTHFNSRFTPQLVDDSYTRVSVEIGCADLHAYTVASN